MEPADFYSGIVVDAYAKLKSSSFDAEPYIDFVRATGEPALEIGCGDGEPMLDLCAAGLVVDGVDSSADMVDRCRQNAAQRGISTRVYHQRVEALNLERQYSSIYFAGPTFNLLPDDAPATRALEAIARHLTGHGVALVPLWVPDPTPQADMGVSRTATDGPGVELSYTPLEETYDKDTRTRVTTLRYQRTTSSGTESVDREWVIHWHTPHSFVAMCQEAGLEVLTLVDDETNTRASGISTEFTATVRRAATV